MSLGPYLGEVYRIAEELRDEVPDDDVDAIYRLLKRLGYEGWCKWKSSNRAAVFKYVESTSAQRSKLKLFKPLMPLLSLAAFQECLTGYELLRTFESHFLFPGGSYRPMAGQASEAFHDVYTLADDEHWPWGWLESQF